MGFFNQLFKNIGATEAKNDTSVKDVLVREMVKRNQVFLSEYKQWISDEIHKSLINHIWEAHLIRISNPNASVNYFIHRQSKSKGFYVRAESPWDSTDYSFFIHYIIEKLKTAAYYLNNSTREAVEENGALKVVEEFYLKPSLKFKRELPYNQLFGNVFIEHRIKGEQTELVKVMVNTYDDVNFKAPYDFDDLMKLLLQLEASDS